VRTLTADLFITLDGFALGERSPAYFGYGGPDLERWIQAELCEPQTLLFGRVTYSVLSGMSRGTDEAVQKMNALPKVVVSDTLREPLEWENTRLVKSQDLQSLKQESGAPIRSMGSISLVKSLLERGLIDRLRLLVFPLILGETGREPIFPGLPDLHLERLKTSVLDGRLVLLEYGPARTPPTTV
jgi:dihydrofolate reductase